MSSLEDIITGLQTPTPRKGIDFTPRYVSESKQRPGTYNALAVPYVKASWIRELLDLTCTPFGWQTDTKEVAGLLCVGIAILNPDTGAWLWKWDTGHDAPFNPAKPPTNATSMGKGVFTTSFKRAAYNWGIGTDVLSLGTKWVACKVYMKDGKPKHKEWTSDPAIAFGYRKSAQRPAVPATEPAVPATERADVDQETGEVLSPQAEDQETGEVLSPQAEGGTATNVLKDKCLGYAKSMCDMDEEQALAFIQPYIDEHGENELAYQVAWNGLVDFRRGRHPSQQ